MTGLAIAPDGSWLAGTGADSRVRRWRVDGTPLDHLSGHEFYATSVDIARDGTWLATSSFEGTVRLWQADGTPLAVLDDHPGSVRAVAIAPDGTWLAAAGTCLVAPGPGFLWFWNADGTPRARVETANYEALAIAPDGSWLAVAGKEGTELRNADGTLLTSLTGGAKAVAIAPTGEVAGPDRLRRRPPAAEP